MDMRELELLVPTLFGLEGLCAEELRRLKLPEVAAENGRVRCKAAPADIPRVNLNLRTGERVLLVVGRYRAADFEALFEGCRALPWEEFIPREGAFPVKGHSLNSQLHAVPACQAVLKKAAAARLGEKYGLETLPESGALYQIQFSIMRDEVTLMLDTTGVGLHKRGYRAVGVAAPLRETLAAAMVLLSRYRGRDPFCDPFCGSGTIAIEAALIAKNRAPGLNRAFSAQKWRWLDSGLWLQAADEAMDGEYDGAYDIWGGDIDPQGGGHRPGQRGEGGCGGRGALRGGGRRRLPPGRALWPGGHQPALWGAHPGEAGGGGALPGFRPGGVHAAGGVAGERALLPHGVRAHLWPYRRQEA